MQATTRKTRILDVVYNASNNELVRTQTLVKSAIVQIDAAPFRQYYGQHYGAEVSSMSQGISWDHCSDGLCCRLPRCLQSHVSVVEVAESLGPLAWESTQTRP